MDESQVWDEERTYLQAVNEGLRDEMAFIDKRFDSGIHAPDEATEVDLSRNYESRYRDLLRADGAPYFARIDFTGDGEPCEKVYIGKTSVYDEQRNTLVTDWRAPVASVYYDHRLGPASYDSPDGTVSGTLSLKRLIKVERGELLDINDIDVTATDELLAPFLSVSTDARLKNIIATIQTEQNAIIRANAYKPLIVQGAAGSGKTTVALHRVAYLAYNMGRSFRPKQFLVLSQGGFFLRYIAPLLPDLGVEDVPQLAFEDLVRKYVRVKFRLHDPDEVTDPDGAYKSSYDILADIDAFLREEKESSRDREEKRSHNESEEDRKKKKRLDNALTVYKRFRERRGKAGEYLHITDLAPLLYTHLRMDGRSDTQVRHIVIDEAQDFNPMQLTVLKTLFKMASFTILGDLAQGIFPYGTESWESLNRDVWQGSAEILTLQKSYRSTSEIMEAAGRVLDRLPGVPKGEAVVRRGEAVAYTDVWGMDDRAAACSRKVTERLAQGHRNIAVILSRPDECHKFARMVNKTLTMPLGCITSREGQYEGGVCLLPAALAKGLEFDSVIVADADRYPRGALGTKLLYVAMTRAMHTLDVVYEGEIPV